MGQKTVRFSDLSGQLITHDDALARIVVHEHPELVDGPVEIEALTDEAEAIEQLANRTRARSPTPRSNWSATTSTRSTSGWPGRASGR